MTWKRKLQGIALIVVASILVIGVTGYVVVRSPGFHEYLLDKIEKQAGEATGTEVRVQSLALHLSQLTADAYGISVRGNQPQSARPLIAADQLTVRLKIVSLLRNKVALNEIILRHPVVNLQVNKDGTTNIPTPPKTSAQGSSNLFDLGIQHVLLNRGEIYYNDVKTPLDAELHDLQLEIKAQSMGKSYDGKLSYRDGRVLYGNMKPLTHGLTANFNATPSEFTLKPLLLTVASSSMELQGQVQNYSQPSASGTYKITVHGQDAKSVLANASIPAGEVVLAGSVRYQQQDGMPLLCALQLDGRLNGRELAVTTADVHTIVRNVRGEFKLNHGNLDMHRLEADLLGGHVNATAAIQHLDSKSIGDIHVSLNAISLDAAKQTLRTKTNPSAMPIEGRITGTADAVWAGALENIKARSDLQLYGAFTRSAGGSASVPVDGEAHVSYDGRSSTATFTNTTIHTPQTRLDVNGTAGNKKVNFKVQAHTADLAEIDPLVAALQPAGPEASSSTPPLASMNLAGAADAQFAVDGTLNDLRIRGQLSGQNLKVESSHWRSLDLRLQASKSGVSIQNGSLVNAQQGSINFALSSSLANWHYLPSSSLAIEVSARDLAMNQLLQLARLNYPISGNLSVDLSMHGSPLNPAGKGSVRLTKATVYGQPVQQVSIRLKGNGDALTSSIDVSMPAGSAKGNFVLYPKRKGYELQLNTPGINLAKLKAQEQDFAVAGVLTANASGHGTFDDPQLTFTAQIPQLQIRDANVSAVRTDINIANHQAHLVVDSEVLQTSVEAQATMDLRDGHYTHATLDSKGLPIEGLIALRGPVKSNSPRGIVEVHASAEGPLDDQSRMQAQVTIPTLKAEYQGLQIGNAQPIRIHYANSVVAVDSAEISGTDTTLRLQGQLPLQGTAPMTLSAVGTIDMQLLRLFQNDLQSSGKVQVDLRAAGPTNNPALQGQLHLQNVSVIPADAPVGLQNLNGILDVRNDQITIKQLAGESGGGQISAQGVIGYRPQLQMNIAIQGKSVRIRYQDAIRTVVGGDLNLVGTRQAANLNGRVLIENLSFTQDFDLATLAGQIQSGPESAPAQGFANNIRLDIGVQTARDLNVTNSAVSLQGQANLRIIGTAEDPVIVGRTQFTGGDIFLMNKRYQIERGVIEFSNPTRTEPVLNLLLTSTINQYNLSLTFLGPLDKLQTSYISDPPLPTADIINLIARGRTTQQAATSASSLGASSLLAQGAASQVSGGIQKLAGLSSLSIDPTLGGNDTDPGARIAMQKRVTNQFLFTFATDVTSTQREIIQGEYQFNKRWSASVTRDENGGFAVDGKYHKRY